MSSKAPKLDTMGKKNAPKLATIGSTSSKETLYVDVDDEITAIIEKVRNAKGTIIALVLPKRATTLQSIVNMKLLKRSAHDAGKNLVLVTSEAGLLPLAGLVGLHIAETPSSRPVIPPMPDRPSEEPESIDEPIAMSDAAGPAEDFNAEKSASIPVGELASAAGATALAAEAEEELIMDDEESETRPESVAVQKNKKLTIPNFNKFRLRAILAVLLLGLLIAGWIVAMTVLPKATIAIQTNSQLVKSNLSLTLDSAAKSVDTQNKILPATTQSEQKTYSQQVSTTGQQNNGNKASGSVTLESSVCSFPAQQPADIPVGSSLKSNNHTYITQTKASFSNPQLSNDHKCFVYTSNPVTIQALKGGAEYNLDANSTFSGAGQGTGSATGGTDAIIKIVAQADIDGAKAKIAAQDTTQVAQELVSALTAKGLIAMPVTLVVGDQQVTTSANVGDQADTLTVTSVVPYTMLGVKQSDLRKLVDASVSSQIDKGKQKILDDGIAKAQYTLQDTASATSAIVNAKIESVAGPELDVASLKKQVAGKRSGDIKPAIDALPGVTDVKVSYSPFWVTKAPTNTSKITINIAKPSGTN
jgi:hypothetical protein